MGHVTTQHSCDSLLARGGHTLTRFGFRAVHLANGNWVQSDIVGLGSEERVCIQTVIFVFKGPDLVLKDRILL